MVPGSAAVKGWPWPLPPDEEEDTVEPDDIRAAMEDPVARRLLASANPARLAYIALDGTPRVIPVGFHWSGMTLVIGTVPGSAKVAALKANPVVALTIDTSPPAWPPNVLLIRGTAEVSMVDGVFPEYVAGARKVTPAEEFPRWEEGVHALYDQMARIDVTPTWVKIHDFETRLPQAVEDLAKAKFGGP
jgi:Pyridoxamine 5'-phosphate oxidase